MENETKRRGSKVRKIVMWTIVCVLALYVIGVALRVRVKLDEKETAQKVAEIHSIRLTMADVDGTKLPPEPDSKVNDATVAGVDVNHNYVRDDVERWIFDHYKTPKERAVWMQWARAEQQLLTSVVNKDTMYAVLLEHARSNSCLSDYYVGKQKRLTLTQLEDNISSFESQIFNTSQRLASRDTAYKFMTSFGDQDGQQCDVEIPA